jgi:hypothetical protein
MGAVGVLYGPVPIRSGEQAMSEVLQLDRYRKPAKPQPKTHGEWFCNRCNFGSFRLFTSGEIICAGCGKQISNLRAVPK